MTNQNSFFSSLNKNTDNQPFGLLFKEAISQPSRDKMNAATMGASPPSTNTPRGSDGGGCDIDYTF